MDRLVLSRGPGIFDSPVVGLPSELLRVFHEHLCHLSVLRILGVRGLEEHAQRDEGHLDRADGGPTASESVETDRSLEETSPS